MATSAKEHWDTIFATKNESEVSWFQPYPKTSIEEEHTTPFQTVQAFLFCSFRRKGLIA